MFDFILIVILLGFVVRGLKVGLIQVAGGLLGAIIGIFVATKLYLPLAASSLGWVLGGNNNLGKVVAFAVIYLAIARALGLVFFLLSKFIKTFSVIPFLSWVDRLLGAAVGLLEGVVLMAGLVYIAAKYPIMESFGLSLAQSKIAWTLNLVVKSLEPLLPYWLAQLRSVFDVPTSKAADYIRQYFKF